MFDVLVFSLTWNVCFSAGICSKQYREQSQDRTFYYQKLFCCDNYEDHNGRCEPCPIGFTSTAKSPCVPCPRNTFGMKCAEYCHCKLDQRCDNEFGCVKVEQTTLITTNDTAHTEEYMVNNLTQTTLSYQESTTNAQRPSIAQLKNQNHKDILNVTNKYIPTEIGEHKTVVVIVGTTSFFIFVFICVLVVYCIRRKLRPRKIFHVIPNNSVGQQDNNGHRNSPHNEIEDDINAYAEIDEERMCPGTPRSRTDQTSGDSNSSSSSKDSKESVNDGYINPYQALITGSKMKLNSEEVFEHEDKEEDEQQRKYSKLGDNVISENVEKTNNNQEKVIYLELEDTNNAEIKPVVESESGDKNEDAIIRQVERTFKRLNTM